MISRSTRVLHLVPNPNPNPNPTKDTDLRVLLLGVGVGWLLLLLAGCLSSIYLLTSRVHRVVLAYPTLCCTVCP